MNLEDEVRHFVALSYRGGDTMPETAPEQYRELRTVCYAGMVIMWRRAVMDLADKEEGEAVEALEAIRKQLDQYVDEITAAALTAQQRPASND